MVYANHLNFMSMERLYGTKEANGKIRYNHQGAPCIVEQVEKDVIRCEFLEPQRAVTPGQALVLYDGDYVLGGGTIFV